MVCDLRQYIQSQLFFFGDYEGLRLRQGQTWTSSVPSLAMRMGDFTGQSTIYDPLTRAPYPGNKIPLLSALPGTSRADSI